MKPCSVCDEPLSSGAAVCPVCGTRTARRSLRAIALNRYSVALLLLVGACGAVVWRNWPATRERARTERRLEASRELQLLHDRLIDHMLEHDYVYPETLEPVLRPRRKLETWRPGLGPPETSDLREFYEIPALDPWGHSWNYEKPASSRLEPRVWSNGPDGLPGTGDDVW